MDWFLPEYWAIFKWQFAYYWTYVWIGFLVFIGWSRPRRMVVAAIISLICLPVLVILQKYGWIII